MEIREQVGRSVKRERERARLTQRELADRLEWRHAQAVSNAERGDREWTVKDLVKVANALDRPVEVFLHGFSGHGVATETPEEILRDIAGRVEDYDAAVTREKQELGDRLAARLRERESEEWSAEEALRQAVRKEETWSAPTTQESTEPANATE